MSTEQVGVIIGRFQVSSLDDEMKKMIQKVKDAHQFAALLLSTNPIPGNREQPLSYVQRRMMIHESFPDLFMMPILDMASRQKWAATVDGKIRESFPLLSVRIYGAPEIVEMYQSSGGKMPITELAGPDVSKTLALIRSKIINTTDFRKGVIYATNHGYRKVISTVDGAVIRGNEILLGRKPNETAYRFMGGFTEVTSESDEEDLSREAMEELGLSIRPDDWYYLGRLRVNDWRYHNSGDVIRTGFYVAFEFQGEPVAGDDLAEVKWFSIDSTPEEIPLVSEHRHLWDRLQSARSMVYEHFATARRNEETRRRLEEAATVAASNNVGDEDVPF